MKTPVLSAMLLGLVSADSYATQAYKDLIATREAEASATTCEDAATATAKAAKARAEAEKEALLLEKKGLETAAGTEKTNYEEAKGRSDTAIGLTKVARERLEVATEDWKTEEDKRLAQNAITDLFEQAGIPVLPLFNKASLAADVASAETKRSDASKALVKINGEVAAMIANVKQHDEEVVTLLGLKETAEKNDQTALTNKAAGTKAKTRAEEIYNGCSPSTTPKCAEAATDAETIVGALAAFDLIKATVTAADNIRSDLVLAVTDYEKAEATKITGLAESAQKNMSELLPILKTANDAYVRKQMYNTQFKALCQTVYSTDVCVSGDTIFTLLNGAAATWGAPATTDKDTAQADYTIAVNAVAILKAKVLISLEDLARLTSLKTTGDTDLQTATTALDHADTGFTALQVATDGLKTTATTAWTKAGTHATSALSEKDDAVDRQALLQTELSKQEVLKGIAEHLQTKGSAAYKTAVLAEAATTVPLARLAALKLEAAKAGTRASAYNKFYADLTAACLVEKGLSDTAVSTVAGKITDCETKITNAGTDVAAAVGLCKRRRYQEALTALEDFTKASTAETAKAGENKTAYDKLKAAGKKTDCRKDKETAVRPECAEGQCCGQANRYEQDGTRRTIEVCSDLKDSSYTYWPEMPVGMLKAPLTEEWRWYCVSGAQSLVAGATALAGALYMAY